jgi:hypothetical protein
MVRDLGPGERRAMEIVSKVWKVVRNTLDGDIVAAVDALVDSLYDVCNRPDSQQLAAYHPSAVKARLRSG